MIQVYVPHFSEREDLLVALPGGERFATLAGSQLIIAAAGSVRDALYAVPVPSGGRVRQLATDLDGNVYALTDGAVHRYDAELGSHEALDISDEASRMAIRGDGQRIGLIALDDNLVRVHDGATGELVGEHDGPDSTHRLHAFEWSGDTLLWTGYGGVTLLDDSGPPRHVELEADGLSQAHAYRDGWALSDFGGGRVLHLTSDGSTRDIAKAESGRLHAFATDGERVAWVETPAPDRSSEASRLVCGGKTHALSALPSGLALVGRTVVARCDGEVRTWPC